MTDEKQNEEIEILKQEIRFSREAASITASLVVEEFVKREEVLQKLVEKSEIELALRKELEQKVKELEVALEKVKTLSGFIPICSSCKKIRDDKGYWNQIEAYLRMHSEAEFSHSICPDCARKLYPDIKIYDD